MGFAAVGLLCGCAGVVGGLLAAGALLRLATVLANRMVGSVAEKAPARSGGIAEWDWDDWDDEEDDTRRTPPKPWGRKQAIPEPGLLKSAGIVCITAFASVLGFVLVGFALETQGFRMRMEETRIAVAIVDLPITFLTLSVLLVVSLPTTFWRSAMVTFFYGLLFIGLAMFIGAVLFVLRVVL